MGGDVTIRSQPGQGSLFRFSFSARAVAPVAVATDQPDQRTILHLKDDQAPPRILVVDDREHNVDILTQMLVRVGYQVRPAANGREAVKRFAAWRPQSVLMDIRMPVMDGIEATKRIRTFEDERKLQTAVRAESKAIIIAVSASALENQRREILQPGLADAFIAKPFKEAEILETLRQYLNVAYVYADIDPETKKEELELPREDVAKAVAELPPPLLFGLKEATINLEVDRLKELVMRVEKLDPGLAGYIQKLVERYDFDALGRLWVDTP